MFIRHIILGVQGYTDTSFYTENVHSQVAFLMLGLKLTIQWTSLRYGMSMVVCFNILCIFDSL